MTLLQLNRNDSSSSLVWAVWSRRCKQVRGSSGLKECIEGLEFYTTVQSTASYWSVASFESWQYVNLISLLSCIDHQAL